MSLLHKKLGSEELKNEYKDESSVDSQNITPEYVLNLKTVTQNFLCDVKGMYRV